MEEKSKIAILIASRMKSTRLPGKALMKIEDQTLIEHVIDRMKCVKSADCVVLCTSTNPEDGVLLEVAEKKGILSFAGSEEDVMKRFLDAASEVEADIIVRVTGDNPLTSPYFITNAIEHHIKSDADYTSTVELPQGTKGEVISVAALRKAYDLAEDTNYSEYMTWYFTENPTFFKIEKGPVDEDMKRSQYRLTVDTEKDLELMRTLYKELYVPGEIIPLKDAIKFLDEHPDLAKMNASVKKKDLQAMKDKVNVKLRSL